VRTHARARAMRARAIGDTCYYCPNQRGPIRGVVRISDNEAGGELVPHSKRRSRCQMLVLLVVDEGLLPRGAELTNRRERTP
jgi:hypothetical protein